MLIALGLCAALFGSAWIAQATMVGPLDWTAPAFVNPNPLRPAPTGYSLNAVACPSATLCVATGSNSRVFTSSNPTGGISAWQSAGLASDWLSSVSCPAIDLCVMVDGGGGVWTSTQPAGGTSAWTPAQLPSTGWTAVSCPTRSFCVAVGDSDGLIAQSTDPAGPASAWHVSTVPGASWFLSVSCASDTACAAVDAIGNVVTSTAPAAGPATWQVRPASLNTFLYDISCPSPALCFIVDERGDVLWSGAAMNPSSSWRTANIAGRESLTTITCPSTALCVAGDGRGNVLVSTNPVGGPSAWKAGNIDGDHLLTDIGCASASLCVATDGLGWLTAGSPAPAGGAPGGGLGSAGATPTTPSNSPTPTGVQGGTTRKLTVSFSGNGSGSVTGDGVDCHRACKVALPLRAVELLTATPNRGSRFDGWTKGCSGSGPGRCRITINADREVVAHFTKVSPLQTHLRGAAISRRRHSATFRFTVSREGSRTQCALTRRGARRRYHPCRSPKTYRHLAPGLYRFSVRSVAGRVVESRPATKAFTLR